MFIVENYLKKGVDKVVVLWYTIKAVDESGSTEILENRTTMSKKKRLRIG